MAAYNGIRDMPAREAKRRQTNLSRPKTELELANTERWAKTGELHKFAGMLLHMTKKYPAIKTTASTFLLQDIRKEIARLNAEYEALRNSIRL